MHASSIENMERCYRRYVAGEFINARSSLEVLDVGAADVNGSYRSIFSDPKIRYVGADMNAGEGVDVVLDDPYKLPFPAQSFDVVLSGQMLEHCEFFWESLKEMVRVLKPDGLLFLIAPSAGAIHRWPVDCYRFYPDAYAALAKYCGCTLVEVFHDQRGPWRDLVGVFSKRPDVHRNDPVLSPGPISLADSTVPSGSAQTRPLPPSVPEEEVIGGIEHYRDVLARLHEVLKPDLYLEIGVRSGGSLRLAKGRAIGVDPDYRIRVKLPEQTTLYRMTSDDFFEKAGPEVFQGAVDLAFIDGLHLFEFALRDFMNIERVASSSGVIVVDDIFPNHPKQGMRERCTRKWTGDIWKLLPCLRRYRPDLTLIPLDTVPTGLLVIAGLDPQSTVLWDHYNPILSAMVSKGDLVPPSRVIARNGAISPDSHILADVLGILAEAKAKGSSADQIRERLRRATDGTLRRRKQARPENKLSRWMSWVRGDREWKRAR